MKNIFRIITLLLFSWHTTFAQATVDNLMKDSTKLYVEYADYKGYVNDSIFSSLIQASLYIGNKASIYIFQTQTVEELLKDFRENLIIRKEAIDKEMVVNDFKKHNDLEKIVSVVYARYHSSLDYLLLKPRDDGDVWRSDTIVYKWTLIKEFKTISGYKCQRATFVNTKGGKVTAWFTEEIPFSVGPLYFSGLPGLILEYHNPITKRFFTATTISSRNIPEEKFRKWLIGPIVSKAEFAVIYADGLKKFQQFKRMLDSETSTKQ